MSAPDFIEVYPDAVPADACAAIVRRFEASNQTLPGRVGGGVHPELKHSRDLTIGASPEWKDVAVALNTAVFNGLMQYLRKYRHALIAPFMLQTPDPISGALRRLEAEDFDSLDDAALARIVRAVLRPGAINLQRYAADEGGYPYWHCELYPKDAGCETLHRMLLWTIYLNDGFADGETQFLYQQRKIVPATGSLLLAPTAFTHTHRGNRPRGGAKMIATSWLLFQRAETLYAGTPG
ncbi:MAG: 2OG-Fe(II) oxygenase [Lysobacteraceae bacterium]